MKILKTFLLVFVLLALFNCSSDDECPEEIIVNINDPESIARAESCGLEPADIPTVNSKFRIYRIPKLK